MAGSTSVISRLFEEGNFEPILVKIFRLLDGHSLESCSLVCWRWRNLIRSRAVFQNFPWKHGVPTTGRLQMREKRRTLAAKADLTHVVVGFEDGTTELWNRHNVASAGDDDGATTAGPELGPLAGHTDLVKSVDLSSNILVSGSWDGGIRLWLRTRQKGREAGVCLGSSYHHQGPVTGVCLSEDRGDILTCSRDGTVRRVILVLGATKRRAMDSVVSEDKSFKLVHEDSVIDMSVDGDMLATGCSGAKVALWKLETQECVRVLRGHHNGIRSVFLRGDLVLSGSRDKTVRLWSAATGQTLRTFQHSLDVRGVALNSEVILTADENSDIFVWDAHLATKREVPDGDPSLLLHTLTGHNGFAHSVQFTPTCIVSCDVTGLLFIRDFHSCVRDRPGLRVLRCRDGVNCMHADSSLLVCGLLDKSIVVYDRSTLQRIYELNGHSDHIWSLDLCDRYIVSGSWDATAKIWSRKRQGELVHEFRFPDGREVSQVKVAGGGRRIFVASLGGTVAVLLEKNEKFETERLLPTKSEFGEIYSMTLDGSRLLTSHSRNVTTIQVWPLGPDFAPPLPSAETSTLLLQDSLSIVWSMTLSPPFLLLCHDNENLNIYHVESQSCLKILKHGQSKVLNAQLHKGVVVVGCQYGLIVLWDLEEVLSSPYLALDINSASGVLNEHSAAISNVFVDSDEIITDDYDGVVIARRIDRHSRTRRVFAAAAKKRKSVGRSNV